MSMTKDTRIARRVFSCAVLMVAVACASSEPKSDFAIDVDSDEIKVAMSAEVARGLIEELIGADLDCKSEVDRGMAELLLELQHDGPRAHATYRDGESTIRAHRRGGKLDLEITGDGPGKIEARMPWAIADCLLGNKTSIDETVTSSITVKVSNQDGRNFSFRLR
jgi:hypothetical protein